jgi:transcriptional regulator with XRE-family HTH domain
MCVTAVSLTVEDLMPGPKELDPDASAEARFGCELRKVRDAAGLTQGQLGDRTGYHANQIGSVERAVRAPNKVLAGRVEDALGLERGRLAGFLPVGKRATIFKTLSPWIDIEARASALWTWQSTIVPGLLQTEEYARAIVAGEPGVTSEQIEEGVNARMARKDIFKRASPPTLWAVLDESILYRQVGTENITRDQLASLVEMAHSLITVQILPFGSRVTAGVAGGFVIAHTDGEPSAAFVDSPTSGRVWQGTSEVGLLGLRYQMCVAEALPQSLSIKKIKERLEQEWI